MSTTKPKPICPITGWTIDSRPETTANQKETLQANKFKRHIKSAKP